MFITAADNHCRHDFIDTAVVLYVLHDSAKILGKLSHFLKFIK